MPAPAFLGPGAGDVLAAMITPAVLISASGTLVLSTSNRLGRVVDRIRKLTDQAEQLPDGTATEQIVEKRGLIANQIGWLTRRLSLLQWTIITLYIAIGFLVASSLTVGLSTVTKGVLDWLPVGFGLAGALTLMVGAGMLVREARLAVRGTLNELEHIRKVVARKTTMPVPRYEKPEGGREKGNAQCSEAAAADERGVGRQTDRETARGFAIPQTPMPLTFLCLASYFKGNRFFERCKADGHTVYLLTIESALKEPWARHALDDVFAVNNFHDRRTLINAVAYLMRSRKIDRIVALDDFDIEVGAHLREHFRMTHTGHNESAAALFRDKLAMRVRARQLGVRIPDFCSLFNDDAINEFLARVPGPWLVKPRSEASAAGIRKVHTSEEVWKRIQELGDDRSFHLLEQMVPGDLFHVDSLTADGEVIFAEVNAYWRPLLDVYQGGGVYATRTYPRDRPEVAELKHINAELLEGFGLGWGASHTEFMRAHADENFYFIETSARVGGANTAEMVEYATGINLWSEWAALEAVRGTDEYRLPLVHHRFAGVVTSLARQERPDTASFTDPEIVYRLEKDYHIGFVVAADTPERVEELLTSYIDRIAKDFHAVLPAADKLSH